MLTCDVTYLFIANASSSDRLLNGKISSKFPTLSLSNFPWGGNFGFASTGNVIDCLFYGFYLESNVFAAIDVENTDFDSS